MDKSTLKNIRLLAPGVIVLVCLLPIINLLNFKSVADKLPDAVILILLTFIAQIIGGIYYGFNVRDLLWRQFVLKCHDNIWNKLIMPHHEDPCVQGVIDHLTKKQATRIFYNIIDNDSSLSDQAHDVRLNGAVLTIIIDVLIISGFFLIAYLCALLITGMNVFGWSAIFMAFLQFFLWILKSRVSKKHMRLETEQLEVIAQLHFIKVKSLLQDMKQRILPIAR